MKNSSHIICEWNQNGNFKPQIQNRSFTFDLKSKLDHICAENKLTGSGKEGRELRDKEKSADTANSDAPVLNMYFDIIYNVCRNKQAPLLHREQIMHLPTTTKAWTANLNWPSKA